MRSENRQKYYNPCKADFLVIQKLAMVSSPSNMRWGEFNFGKLKSLGEEFIFIIWGYSENGNQKGGHNSGQKNYQTITFFSGKSNFYGHFQKF